MDWNDLRFFLSVARTGSLTRTASRLGVSQSTVSRRIMELEKSLGTRLFARHQTGYFLTDEGRRVLDVAGTVEEDILALERGAAGLDTRASGVVRLATPENLSTDLIIPALPAFCERYPGIQLEIITGTVTAQLGRREADLALRVVRPSRGNMTLRRAGVMTYSVYAHRDYLLRHPMVGDDPLDGRAFIVWDEMHGQLPAAVWVAKRAPDCRKVLVTSSLLGQIAAVRAGLGLAVLPDFVATGDDLVAVIGTDAVFSQEIWLVTHADLSASARIRAVSDFLVETLTHAGPTLSGRRSRPRD